ncbi:MAG: trypsin-like peptidase domain-containing protein [Acidaminococcaceae bacterium]|nr:trypsin-like peptidase domain-containing protein [Acidaminococcaceae bacterium]
MNKRIWTKTFSVLMGIILGVILLVSGCSINNKKDTAQAVSGNAVASTAKTQNEQNISRGRNTAIVQAAKKVGPAVVGITNKAFVRDFFNRVQLTERGTGSGVIYSKDGLIATNNHVVEGAQEIVVSLPNGKTYPGRVLGSDAATDLAVVKIDAKEPLTVAEFGNSDDILVGEPAIAIGNPLGLEFRGTVTAGVISALNRSIDLGDRKFKLIQTDAAINPGNSGGALVNADGQVIGINSAKVAASGVEGIGFAIPINEAKPILAELEKNGRIARPFIGVSLVDKDISNKYGVNVDLHDGLYVMKVYQGGPAWRAGIRSGDIITKYNGKAVSTVADLREMIDASGMGAVVSITVLRGDETSDRSVTLTEMPGQ